MITTSVATIALMIKPPVEVIKSNSGSTMGL